MDPYGGRLLLGSIGGRKGVDVSGKVEVVLELDCETPLEEFEIILTTEPHSVWARVEW